MKSNTAYVGHLLQSSDIVCLQEHWLLSYEKKLLSDYFPNTPHLVKSIDDDMPMMPKFRKRGTAGVATLWTEELDPHMQPIPGGSDRVIATRVNTIPDPILLVNTYMPTEGAADSDYAEVLAEIETLIWSNKDCKPVWVGDINGDISRMRTKNDHMLLQFLLENELEVPSLMPEVPTFHHFNGHSASRIDLFIQSRHNKVIEKLSVDIRNPINTGPHDAVTAVIDGQVTDTPSQPAKKNMARPRIKWGKVDKIKYLDLTEVRLGVLQEYMDDLPSPILAHRVNTILQECGEESCPPPPKKKSRKQTKFKWNPKVRGLVAEAKSAYHEFKLPTSSDLLKSARKAKLQAAKKVLRKAQRQAAAKRRLDINDSIIRTCKANKDRFHSIIKEQRRPAKKNPTINFGVHADANGPEDSWANYFKSLATPVDDPTYDKEYHRLLRVQYLFSCLAQEDKPLPTVKAPEIAKIVASLKNNKAPDIFGISAEHLKLASHKLIAILTTLTNKIFKVGILPECFKLGCIAPVGKKKKSDRCPDNYRRITITSLVGKVIEMKMIAHTRPPLGEHQSHLQFGFTQKSSPIYAALAITEAMAEAADDKEELSITFLDTSKAFDVVDHKGMLNSLYQQGIRGSLWRLYDSLYSETQSVVKWEGSTSEPFVEGQGIRQGGPSSTDLYKAGKNKVLNRLERNTSNMEIGSVNLGAVMVADDLALMSRDRVGMQIALNIAESDASQEGYKFNTEKSKSVILNSNGSPPAYILNGSSLGVSHAEAHLGIQRSATNDNASTIADRIKSARSAMYCLRGSGLYGLNGAGPESALIQIDTYIMPILLYGLEALVLGESEVAQLDSFHRKTLRYIQHLPQSTAMPAIYLLLGTPPIEAQLHIRTLGLFGNIISEDNSSLLIKDLIGRQLGMKGAESNSWTAHVKSLLRRYGLPSAYDLYACPPKKAVWKETVKSVIYQHWTEKLAEVANSKRSLSMLNADECALGKTHPVWCNLGDSMSVQKATTKALLLVQRYPLATSPTAGKHRTDLCPLCHEEPETTTHFLLVCKPLSKSRLPYLIKILSFCREYGICVDPNVITMVVLDSTYAPQDSHLESLCRNFVYKMHDRRAVLLGGESQYSKAKLTRYEVKSVTKI